MGSNFLIEVLGGLACQFLVMSFLPASMPILLFFVTALAAYFGGVIAVKLIMHFLGK